MRPIANTVTDPRALQRVEQQLDGPKRPSRKRAARITKLVFPTGGYAQVPEGWELDRVLREEQTVYGTTLWVILTDAQPA